MMSDLENKIIQEFVKLTEDEKRALLMSWFEINSECETSEQSASSVNIERTKI